MNRTLCFVMLCMALVGVAPAQPAPTREQAVLAARAQKDRDFAASPTSPMAGVDRASFPGGSTLWLGPYGTGYATGAQRPAGTLYILTSLGEAWTWASVDGLEKGLLTFGQTFRLGSRTVVAYPYAEELTLICFDAARPEQKAFRGVRYFPYDGRYAVPPQLRVHANPERVTMATSRQTQKTFFRYAEIRFTVEGQPCRLSAFKSDLSGPGSEILFIPFTDLTSGK